MEDNHRILLGTFSSSQVREMLFNVLSCLSCLQAAHCKKETAGTEAWDVIQNHSHDDNGPEFSVKQQPFY